MSQQTKQPVYGFIGLGLIGGSIARALRAASPSCRIIAYDINKEALSLAVKEGVASRAAGTIDETFSACSYLFLCAPVTCNEDNLLRLRQFLSPDVILTDVGSVKTPIHAAVRKAGLEKQFIGGHPMAGSERVGYGNSAARLLENAYYILTPTDKAPPDRVEDFQRLIVEMGAIPLRLTCEQHDYVTAAISHLPHIIASCLVNLVRDSDSEDGVMKMIAAGGFKDITRIASSSPEMWQQICMTNPENIFSLLDAYITSLIRFRKTLNERKGEELYRFFDEARRYRDSFIEASSGPIKKAYTLGVDIADKPGSLAAIAGLLAGEGISIKNIGIVHNRELAEGALRIEFYEEQAVSMAEALLDREGYELHIATKD